MIIARTRAELRAHREGLSPGIRLGFVPTMGALHPGHLSLLRQAREKCDQVWSSIFVNPIQFAPGEDLARYPKPFEQDVELLKSVGCELLFAPERGEMYAIDASTAVVEDSVGLPLCGSSRPGHFRGVTTVVLKLFNLVQPHHAYFGQKDAQQCAVIERMVRDLDVPVRIHRGPTVREADGLAMSSRNVYLSPAERAVAPALHSALRKAKLAFAAGQTDARRLEDIAKSALGPEWKLQYLEVRDGATLEGVTQARPGCTVFAAAYLGTTRLIDNLELGA